MIAWALVLGLRAEGARTTLTDAAIEQRKSELEQTYRQAAREAEEQFQAGVSFHTRLKDERLEFERLSLERREEMLDSLRGLPASRRQAVYDQFHVDEARRRQQFREHVAELTQAFRRGFSDERADARRALSQQRRSFAEQHRQSP